MLGQHALPLELNSQPPSTWVPFIKPSSSPPFFHLVSFRWFPAFFSTQLYLSSSLTSAFCLDGICQWGENNLSKHVCFYHSLGSHYCMYVFFLTKQPESNPIWASAFNSNWTKIIPCFTLDKDSRPPPFTHHVPFAHLASCYMILHDLQGLLSGGFNPFSNKETCWWTIEIFPNIGMNTFKKIVETTT